MANIGIVFAGGATKGAYEIGVIRAIEEYFGMDSIKCVSSASIGSLITQAHGNGKLDEFIELWKNVSPKKHGRFTLLMAGNEDIVKLITDTLGQENHLPYEHYVSLWNYTQKKVEYVPFHTLEPEKLTQYLKGAISMPIFSSGELIDGDRILDGAFLDNIPVYPLKDKDLDYIFCVYFDNCKYFFEDDEFNRKIVKLYDFPNDKMIEILVFSPESIDQMIQYGYDYTMKTIKELFAFNEPEKVYAAIADNDANNSIENKKRFTADVVLMSINNMTQKYSKRMSKRIDIENDR